MTIKLVRAGDSLAVPLPRELVAAHGLQDGEELHVSLDSSSQTMCLHLHPRYYAGGKVTPEFKRMVEETLEEYAELWKRLADS